MANRTISIMGAAVMRTVARWRDEGTYPYLPVVKAVDGAVTNIDGFGDLVSFASCDYVGISQLESVKQAAVRAAEEWGTNTPGAQLFSGHTTAHRELELALGLLHHGHALTFSSGLHANLGVFATLPNSGDSILIDQFAHSSIVMGASLSPATLQRFRHRDMGELRRLCAKATGHIWIATDGVFSADGTVADVVELRGIAREYGATLIIDDAHGVGALGHKGQGIVDRQGLGEQSEILVGTFSKALGASGGYIVSNRETVDLLRHAAAAYQVSRGLNPMSVAAALAGIAFVDSEGGRQVRQRLRFNAAYLREELKARGFDVGNSSTHVVPVLLHESDRTIQAANALKSRGYLVSAMIAPMVPLGAARLRLCVTAAHDQNDLSRFADSLRESV